MLYLLTLGWPWFAGACALGALVGFLTFKTGKDAAFSGGWAIVLGALALAGGAFVSWRELLEGVDAARFDIALLAGFAYAAGLPLGGMLKSLVGEAPAKTRPVVAPLLIAPAPVALPEPVMVPPAPEPEEAQASEAPAPVAEAPPAPPTPAVRAKKTPGVKPQTLAEPRNGAPDDLSRIKGVGPKTREKLHAFGVFHYDQIAAWNLDNARWVGASIGAPGRVERDKWIQQARALAGAGADQ